MNTNPGTDWDKLYSKLKAQYKVVRPLEIKSSEGVLLQLPSMADASSFVDKFNGYVDTKGMCFATGNKVAEISAEEMMKHLREFGAFLQSNNYGYVAIFKDIGKCDAVDVINYMDAGFNPDESVLLKELFLILEKFSISWAYSRFVEIKVCSKFANSDRFEEFSKLYRKLLIRLYGFSMSKNSLFQAIKRGGVIWVGNMSSRNSA